MFEQYEDRIRMESTKIQPEFITPYQDFRYYESSVSPGVRLALNVIKPERPSRLLVQLHGWHMSMPKPKERIIPVPDQRYLIIQVDMRGRAFSEGSADCNGLELIDIYDAVRFVKEQYAEHLLDPDVVYLEGGSGGGGNVLAAINKFPDLFAAATALYGIADYAEWYACDRIGEFRDDMDVWIGVPPWEALEPYEARSGAFLAHNQLTPLLIAHGTFDARVPVSHSRMYLKAVEQAGKADLLTYVEWPCVGGDGHTDRLTDESLTQFQNDKDTHEDIHSVPIHIPNRGTFLVGGYLYTNRFIIRLDSVDRTARVDYDLEILSFEVTAKRSCTYRIETVDGLVIEGAARIKD